MKEKIYNLLMVEYRGVLESCYRSVFYADSALSAIKTFEDYLNDFYLYLYDAKPKYVDGEVHGYYLLQIRDEKSMPAWLKQTFRHFLLEENKILVEMRDSLEEYSKQQKTLNKSDDIDITLMHVAFAIAWFNQHESATDRFIFFRNAYKHFMGFYTWTECELDDKQVAEILNISYGTLRTRSSRLCLKVKKLVSGVSNVSDSLIVKLKKSALELAHRIYADTDPDISGILMQLLRQAEEELPMYKDIIALQEQNAQSLRHSKKHIAPKNIHSVFTSALREETQMERNIVYEDEYVSDNAKVYTTINQPETNRIVLLFKELIGM